MLSSSLQTTAIYEDGVMGYGNWYGVPNYGEFVLVYYNQEMFDEHGVEVPTTLAFVVGGCDRGDDILVDEDRRKHDSARRRRASLRRRACAVRRREVHVVSPPRCLRSAGSIAVAIALPMAVVPAAATAKEKSMAKLTVSDLDVQGRRVLMRSPPAGADADP